ncbi:MAG: hypothetical protein FWC85_04130 [Elusimicrobia bacterium]|nr:hypothetical protein [Elusimicrobiota bacterium]
MKKIFSKIILTLLVLALSGGYVFAAFNTSYWGVRPMGMGGAFTSVTNDANAPLYNPAGLAFVRRREATLMSSRLFAGLDGVDIAANYAAFVWPLSEEIGVVSIAWAQENTPGLRREDLVNIGFGRFLCDIIRIHDNVFISAGVNIRYLRHEFNFQSTDPVSGNSRSAVTADIGIMAVHENGLGVGFSSRNLIPADLGFVERDIVSNENVLGVSYFTRELPFLWLPYFTISGDFIFRDGDFDIRMGAETWLADGSFAIRAGGRREEINMGFGWEFLLGRSSYLVLDYALGIPIGGIEGSLGSHFISLSFRFD